MLKKFLNYQMSLVEKGKPLHKLRPLIQASDTFLYEAPINTRRSPHIRDAVDLKRWMLIVVFALVPCILMAIWNTGLQKMVYGSGNYHLMNEYLNSSTSFSSYFNFVSNDNRYLTIIHYGLMAFLPVMLISYVVGGFWEAVFASIRGHEISEGFLVTGMLYALILPPSIPYWMVAVGVSAGVVIGKELFGGTGMNILNPALTCRCFLFFTFPSKMTGDVWVGTNPTAINQSLNKMKTDANLVNSFDGYSQATPLAHFNVTTDIKRVHIEAIASGNSKANTKSAELIQKHFEKWNSTGEYQLDSLLPEQMKQFVTGPLDQGGLGLSPDNYQAAYNFSSLNYGLGNQTDANFFWGNRLGSMGETSVIACLIGAIILIYTGVGSWRTMAAVGISAYISAWLFEFFSTHFGVGGGAWNPAKYAFPAYKHLLLGGLWFGLVFMATDPVSAPSMKLSKWIYGAFIGALIILIRVVNPAYPEGIMLAILMGNVFAPLIDHYVVKSFRRPHRVTAA